MKTINPSKDNYNFVDLGIRLNGYKILFADKNIGAEKPEDYGDYLSFDECKNKLQPSDKIMLPTKEELYKLFTNTTIDGDKWEHVIRLTGKGEFSKNSIIIPTAAYFPSPCFNSTEEIADGAVCDDINNDYGVFWTRSTSGNTAMPQAFFFGEFPDSVRSNYNKHAKFTVRPVLVIPE